MLALVISVGALALSLAGAFRFSRGWVAAVLVSAVSAVVAGISVLLTGEVWEWRSGVLIGGEPVHLRLDGLSAWFLVLLAVVGGAGAAYATEYWKDDAHPVSAGRGRFCWSVLMLGMGLVLVCANGLHFLIVWELFAVSAYFLITLDARRVEVRRAGWLYLGASHFGTLVLLAFFALWAARTGSWELGLMRDRPELGWLYWLALVGFGVKAGLFPLHVWLPSAHASAPSHVSAIMSGVAIKMGVYGIVRFGGWLPVPEAAGWCVVVMGMGSAVLGVLFALGQHDLKRLLAYHSVENIGIILLGVGFGLVAMARDHAVWGALALAGGLLHVWNHGLFKSLLFLGAGAMVHATGTREMSRLGGLWRLMPWTASLFGLGAVAIAGLPPLNGFVSEWLLYLGMFEALDEPRAAVVAAVPGIVLLALTGALALACFVKVCGIVLLGAPRTDAARSARECGWWMRTPMMLLAFGCVLIGLGPQWIWPALHSALGEVLGRGTAMPASLGTLGMLHVALALGGVSAAIWLWRRAHRGGWVVQPTWDCGYAAPTSRMQYTAGSFASTITGWFGWILRPEREVQAPEGLFPRHASFEQHTPETVLEHVVEPVAGVVMRCSSFVRRLQHGRAQAYVAYVIAGLALVAVLVLTCT
jgi:hydrogenase-4 component B